jgi:hypothetical protein
MAAKTELACVYSALILVDDDVAVTVSNYYFLKHSIGIAPNPFHTILCTRDILKR